MNVFPRLHMPMSARRFHYAWVIVAVTFLSLLAAQAVRAAPGIIIVPLETEFGWDRATVSLAVAFSLITFGLGGPLGGTFIDRFGPRRVILAGNLSIIIGLAAMLFIRELWQLYLVWGIFIGLGTGAVGGVLGAAIAHRWFRKNQGIVIGAFGGATSAGQLVFVPAMAQLTVSDSWRAAITLMLVAGLAMLTLQHANRVFDCAERTRHMVAATRRDELANVGKEHVLFLHQVLLEIAPHLIE